MFRKLYLHTVTEHNTSHRDLSWIQSVIVTAKGGLRLHQPHQLCQSHKHTHIWRVPYPQRATTTRKAWTRDRMRCHPRDMELAIHQMNPSSMCPVLPLRKCILHCSSVCLFNRILIIIVSPDKSGTGNVSKELLWTLHRNVQSQLWFPDVCSGKVCYVMGWRETEGVHWVMTWTIAGELSEV